MADGGRQAIAGGDVVPVQDHKNDGFGDLISRSLVHTCAQDGEATTVAHHREAKTLDLLH